jgi:hypothetical protein
MAVAYLSGGESVTAERMNLLCDRLDLLMEKALDGKSFFNLTLPVDAFTPTSPVIGKLFLFCNGSRPRTSRYGAVYNHDYFDGLAAAATPISQNDDLRILTCSGISDALGPLLDGSLQAHKVSGTKASGEVADFYLRAENWLTPERKYNYAVAELLYEGAGNESITWPARWDKYSCFRIHNLNSYEMAWQPEGSDFSVTIPAWECRSVRRTGTTWDATYRYFWQFQSGDPRVLTHMWSHGVLDFRGGLYRFQAANPITNAEVFLRWVDEFKQGIGTEQAGKFYCDPGEVRDIGELYASYFPDATDTAQIFGNFFHHKGALTLGENTNVQFRGYETIIDDFALSGLLVEEAGNALAISSPDGPLTLEAKSTNLLSMSQATPDDVTVGPLGSRPAVILPVALDSTIKTAESLDPLKVEIIERGGSDGFVQTFYENGDGTSFPVGNYKLFRRLNGIDDDLPALSFYRSTVADVLTLNAFGTFKYQISDQETEITKFQDRRLVLTAFGPKAIFDYTVSFAGSYYLGNLGLQSEILTNPMNEVSSDAVFTCVGELQFGGYGFADSSRLAFLSPRFSRQYAPVPQETDENSFTRAMHPNVANDIAGPDGADFSLRRATRAQTDIAFLAAIQIDQGAADGLIGFNTQLWQHPDGLYGVRGFAMPVVLLLQEHYNAIAQVLNSVKKVRPLDFSAFLTQWGPLGPSTNFAVAPRTMYCAFHEGSNEWNICHAMGIPIKTSADFPASFAEAMADVAHQKVVNFSIKSSTISVTDSPDGNPSVKKVTTRQEYQGTEEIDQGEIGATFFDDFTGAGGWGPVLEIPTITSDMFWVTIEDVKAAAESLGWIFLYQVSSVPCKLAQYLFSFDRTLETPTIEDRTFDSYIPASDPPATVGYEETDILPFSYTDRRWAFIEDTDGEWKLFDTLVAGPQGQQIFDARAGDELVMWSEPINWGIKLNTHEDWRRIDSAREGFAVIVKGETVRDDFRHRTKLLFQNYWTGRIQDESRMILIPVAFPEHAQAAFASESYANLKARAAGLEIPARVFGGNGQATAEEIQYGETVYEPSEDSATELVPFLRPIIRTH